MPRLSELLQWHAVGDADLPVLELIVRADAGLRLITAAAVASATAEGFLGGPVRQTLHHLLGGRRSQTGFWQFALRLVLDRAQRTDSPLSAWAQLAVGHPSDWLSDYEKALRHTGRAPPEQATAALARSLAERGRRLADELTAAWDPVVSGDGLDTLVEGAPVAPLLLLNGETTLVWEGTRRRGEIAYRALQRGHANQVCSRPALATPLFDQWLMHAPLDHPLRHWTGAGTAAIGSWVGLRVWPTPAMGALQLAGEVVDRARTADRPALLLCLGSLDDPAFRLATELGGTDPSELPALLGRWAGAPPVVIFVPWGLTSPRSLLELADTVGALAEIGVVTGAHEPGLWPHALRRACLVETEANVSTPAAVLAQGSPHESDAWLRAAAERFETHTELGLTQFLQIVDGVHDPLRSNVDAELTMNWLERGDLSVDARGRIRLRHAGWRAFADGCRGRPCPDTHRDAWTAGQQRSGGSVL